MTIMQAIKERHSVRAYKTQAISLELIENLNQKIKSINHESGLHFQFVINEPKAFHSPLAKYGLFKNVNHYFVLAGKDSKDLQELCGYYGEALVLYAQQLGLNTCWVALTFKKIPSAFMIGDDEKLVAVIAVGYGKNQGKQHKSKKINQVMQINIKESVPVWFERGVKSALLAPTAMNQQSFKFILEKPCTVSIKTGLGFCTQIDKGIVKYHFEVAAGTSNFKWK